MKKIFFLICSVLFLLALDSCREDGEWSNNNGGQFGFTIERDEDFIEKAIGEENQLKFNIVPNYDFTTVKTVFKFTTSLNGVLKLNDEVLQPNQEYTFAVEKNIFQYRGNVSGTHELKISVKNDKGASKEELFSMPYAVSDFTHTFDGGTGPIYQGDETQYLLKIVPGSGQSTTGYQIRFNNYSGQVKLNGVLASLGTWYPLNNIENFTTSLSTNAAGQGKLTYSIKNSTISRDYEIQQNIQARTITIENLSFSPANISVNTPMTFSGIINKSPANHNTTIQYRTWISSASNSNLNGIQNTQSVYVNYALGTNGSIHLNANPLAAGNYTYNIQVRDEFGNESAVKTFDISVLAPIYFDENVNTEGAIKFRIPSPTGSWRVYQHGFKRKFRILTGGNSTITSIIYELNYDITTTSSAIHVTRTYTENISPGTKVFERNNELWETIGDQVAQISGANLNIINLTMKITGTASTGESATITIVPEKESVIN